MRADLSKARNLDKTEPTIRLITWLFNALVSRYKENAMDFQKLELFLHLAETLNFSTTADALHISQPAVTKAIKTLEDELGFQLFQRGKRYVRLTESGKSFYEDCKHITRNMNLAINRARSISQRISSSLSVGYTGTVLEMQCLPYIVKKLKEEHPDIKLYLCNSSHIILQKQLLNDECDFIFTTLDDVEHLNSIQFISLIEGHFVCLLPPEHRLRTHTAIQISELANENLIFINALQAPPGQSDIQSLIRRQCPNASIYFTDSIILSHTLVQGNVGIAVMPSFVTSQDNNQLASVTLSVDYPLWYGIACKSEQNSEFFADLIRFTKEILRI
ncbi:LysR family transcriptional regulator [Streptococcus chenjunshii]|uniref:LysR family transcriptional regulator n=2 Tax=Streptococcus chenjunshii TaxID=2173853 RepID=A0A372KK65_9STRE|nr:LysR family transcriptional regulator [Streptococcus chenjunshii]RFU50432.1 LysR family transcriptional regulator [Streptococcus chenjunshii]RFU52660.1 LysR family transcriptional regulator [Streptococcus chenjunshii]